MIRPYEKKDSEACMALWAVFDKALLEESEYFFREPMPKQIMERHKKYSQGRDSMFLVCEKEGEIAGFILGMMRKTPSVALLRDRTILEIHALSVLEKYQGRGIAGELMETALEFARKQKVQDVESQLWVFNTVTEKLFIKYGFKVQSRKYRFHIHD
ncbi:MAG: GNAT family N-acetyltransferase [Spirochaetales bacterium]|nr:GNAT family N-acetyltransferase [Spirochaetales bacterium]